MVPVILILIVNTVILIVSLRVVSRVVKQQRGALPDIGRKSGGGGGGDGGGGGLISGQDDSDSWTPARVKKMLHLCAVFATLLGTPWILGLFYHPKHEWTLMFAYLFVFFTAFQVYLRKVLKTQSRPYTR